MNAFSMLGAFGAVEITFTVIGAILLIAIILLLVIVPVKAYFTSLISKAHISMAKLTSLKNCKIDPMTLVEAYILAKKSGVTIKVDEIESVILAGGNAKNVVSAMKLAKEAQITLPFSLASALEIRTKDSLEIVKSAVELASQNVENIKGITKDNYELTVEVNLILKLQIHKYLFGLSTDKIKSFVIENVIKKIPQFEKNQIFNDPQILVRDVNFAEASHDSAYIIQDARVANVSIVRDINLEMEVKKAEKERVYAQMQADRMKNAEEMKELRARTQTEETKASLLEAEAQIPNAISQAIKEGRFSVMDYYKLMNLQADTALRRSIISNSDDDTDDSDSDDDDIFGDDE